MGYLLSGGLFGWRGLCLSIFIPLWGQRGLNLTKKVKFQHWTNGLGVTTGTRIVRMVRHHEIPLNATINGVKCGVWYKG